MREYYPLIVVGGVIGLISIVFSLAYALIKNKKEAIGFDRNMKDGEIVRRLLSRMPSLIGGVLSLRGCVWRSPSPMTSLRPSSSAISKRS